MSAECLLFVEGRKRNSKYYTPLLHFLHVAFVTKEL